LPTVFNALTVLLNSLFYKFDAGEKVHYVDSSIKLK